MYAEPLCEAGDPNQADCIEDATRRVARLIRKFQHNEGFTKADQRELERLRDSLIVTLGGWAGLRWKWHPSDEQDDCTIRGGFAGDSSKTLYIAAIVETRDGDVEAWVSTPPQRRVFRRLGFDDAFTAERWCDAMLRMLEAQSDAKWRETGTTAADYDPSTRPSTSDPGTDPLTAPP